MWKQVLPAWVERCRTDSSHGKECEYRAAGKIPLTDQHDNKTQFLCSCGQDVFPEDFKLPNVPSWLSMASKYCTRAAISPVFWAPSADEVYLSPMGELGRQIPTGGCHVCGLRLTEGRKLLMVSPTLARLYYYLSGTMVTRPGLFVTQL